MKRFTLFICMVFLGLVACSEETSELGLVEAMGEQIMIDNQVENDIDLPSYVSYHGELYEINWTSSNEDIIDSKGDVHQAYEDIVVTLKARVQTPTISHTMSFEVEVMKKEKVSSFIKPHQYVMYAKDFDVLSMNYLSFDQGKLQLKSGQTMATYESEVIDTPLFSKLVGSWAAQTSVNATIELKVRVMVNGEWSRYVSYRPWGLGRNNFSLNTSDHLIALSIDEVLVLNNQLGEKIQFQVLFERDDAQTPSPSLDLVSFAFTIPYYDYQLEVDDLPNYIDYDVPKLNQQAVPNIGSRICSPTSSAMLLLYKGHDLYVEDELPHRYTSSLFMDHGARIYGNWVYNTVGMSSFNEKAYVGKMYGFEELMDHLVNVGPLAASVRGDMGLYTTGGHLVVVRGYRMTDNGHIFVLVNDPNINDRFGNDDSGQPLFVYYEYPLETFMNAWNGIVYIIE